MPTEDDFVIGNYDADLNPITNQSNPDLEKIQELKNENTELNDKYIRLYADFDNYKKRVMKDKEEIVLNTKKRMLESIIELDDDISLAIKNTNDKSSLEGLNLILNKVSKFLKSNGAEEIDTTKYDPDLHDVITVLETGEEKIIDVISKGWTIDGKPFKYPKIVLSK